MANVSKLKFGDKEYEIADKLARAALAVGPVLNVTYSELVELRNNKELTPNKIYRIIDYVTTTNGEADDSSESRSAGHVFDVIVKALTEDTLEVEASAALHEGDTYFENANIEQWKIWYDLDNNIDRYSWADEDNGKGVIFRMIDDRNNDFPYDFKNMQFYVDKTDTKYEVGRQNGKGDGVGGTLNTHLLADDGFYYTFSLFDGISTEVQDASILYGSIPMKWTIDGSTRSHNKKVQIYNNHMDLNQDPTIWLCANVLLYDGSQYIASNVLCYDNKFPGYFHNNVIQLGNFSDNVISTEFNGNLITGTHFQSNTIGANCEDNVFGYGFHYNTIGESFKNNSLVNCDIIKCTFEDEVQENIIYGINSRWDRCNFKSGFMSNKLYVTDNLENSTFEAEFWNNSIKAKTVRECHFLGNVARCKFEPEGVLQGIIVADNVCRLNIPKNPDSTTAINVLDVYINSIVAKGSTPTMNLDYPGIYTDKQKSYAGPDELTTHFVVKGITNGYGLVISYTNAQGYEEAYKKVLVDNEGTTEWSAWTKVDPVSVKTELSYDSTVSSKLKATITKSDATTEDSEVTLPYVSYNETDKELILNNLFFSAASIVEDTTGDSTENIDDDFEP